MLRAYPGRVGDSTHAHALQLEERATSRYSMGYKFAIFVILVTLLAAFIVDILIKSNHFTRIYDHFPGNCSMFHLNGSEDFALYPNDHVLVSSGLEIFGNEHEEKPLSGIFVVDLQESNPHPAKLSFEGNYLTEISPDFNPHGLGAWVTKNGEYHLYVVNHRSKFDAIDSFIYHPESKSLEYQNTMTHPELFNINDVVVVDKDVVYVTRDRYYKSHSAKFFETIFQLPYASIFYVDGRKDNEVDIKMAVDGFGYANGIAKSNNGRFIYVNECLYGSVTALTINKDNTLSRHQTIVLEVAPDNTFVSPVNGHLWVGLISKPLQFEIYKKHPTPSDCGASVGGRILHVAINEDSENPFDSHRVEEIFSTSVETIGAVSSGLYHNNKLLVGSIRTEFVDDNNTQMTDYYGEDFLSEKTHM